MQGLTIGAGLSVTLIKIDATDEGGGGGGNGDEDEGVSGEGRGAAWRNSRTINEANMPRDTAPVLPK